VRGTDRMTRSACVLGVRLRVLKKSGAVRPDTARLWRFDAPDSVRAAGDERPFIVALSQVAPG
jgi:hypothetical protein